MVEKPKALHVLGLEMNDQEVKGAKLSQKKGKPILDELFFIPLNKELDDVKPLYIQNSGKTLKEIAKNYLIATALPQADVLVRSLDVTLKKAGDIDSVLAFQAEPILPYAVENAVLDRIIISQNTEGSELILLSARKERLQAFLDQWRNCDIEPEVVTSAPAALAAFSTIVANDKPLLFVVHISKTQTVCVLVREGRLAVSQACGKHLGSLEHAFALDNPESSEEELQIAFAQICWEEISAESSPHVKEALDLLKLELTRTLFSLSKHMKGVEVSDILLTGDCAKHYDLVFFLGHALHKNVLTPEIPSTFNAPLPQVLKFAIPIGIALGNLPTTKDCINFRQGEFAYPDPWKRLKKPLSIYFGLCIAAASALFLFGNAYQGLLEDEIRVEYSSLLSVAQKPHTEFEKKLGSTDTEPASLKEMSMDQLRDRVQILEKELASTPDIFPLLPNILTVSDVLAWINSQPTIATLDPKTGKLTPLIQIDNFSYTMVKRPEITKKNERYQVKVELEFSTPTPKEAREFHDALITPNTLVDPKGEVKWSTNRGKYRASFYLKDKTTYPTIGLNA